MKVNYKCKDNDVVIRFYCEDGKIDEVWVQVDGETSWTVIGYDDFMNGIKKAKNKITSTTIGKNNKIMKNKETLFDILLKVSELEMDIETAEKKISQLYVKESICSCGSENYGYGFAKCFDCGKIKDF